MPTKIRCEDCKFFKKHTFFGKDGFESLGGTCLITNKTTKCVVANNVVTFDLQNQCPLKRLKDYDRLRQCWGKLIDFVVKLEKESEHLEFQAKLLLRDVVSKISELEKGE